MKGKVFLAIKSCILFWRWNLILLFQNNTCIYNRKVDSNVQNKCSTYIVVLVVVLILINLIHFLFPLLDLCVPFCHIPHIFSNTLHTCRKIQICSQIVQTSHLSQFAFFWSCLWSETVPIPEFVVTRSISRELRFFLKYWVMYSNFVLTRTVTSQKGTINIYFFHLLLYMFYW